MYSINPMTDGRALRRLRKRFPDLEARLAEVQLAEVPSMAKKRAVAMGAAVGAVGSCSKGGEVMAGVDGVPAPRQLRRSGRFRGRVAGWVRRARRGIGRAGVGSMKGG